MKHIPRIKPRSGRVPRIANGRLGIIVTAGLAVVLLVVLGSGGLSKLGGSRYRAAFAEAGGLVAGDSVIVSGMPAGKVEAVDLMDTWVQVTFSITDDSVVVGDATTAQIKAQTPLGKKALQLVPEGARAMSADATIPLTRTTPPYDVSEALQELTQNVSDVDQPQLGDSMNALSDTFEATAPQMQALLAGLTRISNTIGSRDQAVADLLNGTKSVSGVLAKRDQQVQRLIDDGAVLFSAINDQSAALETIFGNATAFSSQLQGLVDDNQAQLKPALDQLDQTLAILQRNRDSVAGTLVGGTAVLRTLGEVAASFPGFNVYVANLPPWNVFPNVFERPLKDSNLVHDLQSLLAGGS